MATVLLVVLLPRWLYRTTVGYHADMGGALYQQAPSTQAAAWQQQQQQPRQQRRGLRLTVSLLAFWKAVEALQLRATAMAMTAIVTVNAATEEQEEEEEEEQ